MFGTLRWLCVYMVAQLHAVSAQQSKHLLSVEFLRGNTAQHIFFSCFHCVNAEMLNKAISRCDKFTLWDKKAGGMNLAKTCAFCVRCKSPSDIVDGQRGAAKRFFSFIPP